MIGRIYRLIDTRRIEMKEREISFDTDTVLVRPEYLSICASDQRYYLGLRRKEILNEKLPMALIHEAVGTVIRDFGGKLQNGTKVVLVPLDEGTDHGIKGNYRKDSKFASSGVDGFMRDIVAINRYRLVPIEYDYSKLYVFTEILSVAIGAIKAFDAIRQSPVDSIGVWGDGSMGFITALALRCKYRQAKLYVFGKSVRKLSKFSFVTEKYYIDDIPGNLMVEHAFECVGGKKSEEAIAQIVERVIPQGVVSLLGVSENAVRIETRKVLDKGLVIIGNSRSNKDDFEEAVSLIGDNSTICRDYMNLLISETIDIKNETDISLWFERDAINDFKTIGKWLM